MGRKASSSEPHQTLDQAPSLAPDARRLHRALIDALIVAGSVPSVPELADRLGTTGRAIRSGLAALVAADYLALDGTGRVSCLYPFSTTPTPHAVTIGGQTRYAMCAIDALGIPAMLDRELEIAGRCAICNAPIALRVGPGTVVGVEPPTAMAVARRDEKAPAFAACCPFTVFVCGQLHADQFMRQITNTHALTISEALVRAEEIFAGLLADAIPATRRRGATWGPVRLDSVEEVLTSVITCPGCGHQREEAMPEISCAIVYQCAGCGAVLRPLAGDCCVYCSFGSVPCPAIQRERQAANASSEGGARRA